MQEVIPGRGRGYYDGRREVIRSPSHAISGGAPLPTASR